MKFIRQVVACVVFLAPLGVMAGFWGPSNAWECILDEMPGVQNDAAAREIMRKCRKDYPSPSWVEKKSPLLGVSTAGECVIEYAKDVSSPLGARFIAAACYKLYPKE